MLVAVEQKTTAPNHYAIRRKMSSGKAQGASEPYEQAKTSTEPTAGNSSKILRRTKEKLTHNGHFAGFQNEAIVGFNEQDYRVKSP